MKSLPLLRDTTLAGRDAEDLATDDELERVAGCD